MTKSRCRRLGFLLLLLGTLYAAGCGAGGMLCLKIGSRESGEVFARVPVSVGDLFYLDYVHSSEKTPIRDTFVVAGDGTLVLTEERYSWYAVGLEFSSEYREASIEPDGENTRVVLRRVFPALPIRVGWVAQQVVSIGSRRIRLDSLAPAGTLLDIWVE